MISLNVKIRNADAHLIYNCANRNRINPTRSVFIGDHIWIGQDVTILKGAQIDSGSIIGASSVVAGKKIHHNCIWGGNPAREIKKGIFWDGTCTHGFTCEMTESSMNYGRFIAENKGGFHDDYWIYEYDENQVIEYDFIDEVLSQGSVMEKLEFLIKLNANKTKNRFVHK